MTYPPMPASSNYPGTNFSGSTPVNPTPTKSTLPRNLIISGAVLVVLSILAAIFSWATVISGVIKKIDSSYSIDDGETVTLEAKKYLVFAAEGDVFSEISFTKDGATVTVMKDSQTEMSFSSPGNDLGTSVGTLDISSPGQYRAHIVGAGKSGMPKVTVVEDFVKQLEPLLIGSLVGGLILFIGFVMFIVGIVMSSKQKKRLLLANANYGYPSYSGAQYPAPNYPAPNYPVPNFPPPSYPASDQAKDSSISLEKSEKNDE